MIILIKRVLKSIGVDHAIGYTMISRIIQGVGGGLSVFFLASFLSKEEQGFYFTFTSILAVQLFFELGLNTIITQFTAHECAAAKWVDGKLIFGDKPASSRVASLLRLSVKLFGGLSVLLLFTLLVFGYYFFGKYGAGNEVEWQLPWIILSFTTASLLFINPILAFIEGLGKVKEIALLRLIQQICSILGLFIGLTGGLKLFAAPLAQFLSLFIIVLQLLLPSTRRLLVSIWKQLGLARVSYIKDIFPFQWRIALSWISGYFIFQLFNPVLFASAGADIAGQMGLTLAALNGVMGISLSWYNTKIPLFSNLIARKEFNELDIVFIKSVSQATTVCFIMLLLFNVTIWGSLFFLPSFASRFTPLLPLAMLSIITLANQYVYGLATYLRCHKKEPFLIQSIVIGGISGVSTVYFGSRFGILGITTSYFIITVFFSLFWSVYIFNRMKNRWHT